MKFLAILGLAKLASSMAFDTTRFGDNLNYFSPSRRHDTLGIDISVVSARTLKRGAVPFKPSELHFTHGVASGDPLPDSVILWTRVAPSPASDKSNITVEGTVDLYNHETEQYIKADPNPICVDWRIWDAKDDKSTAAKGTAYTTSDIDFTVKVEAKGLRPFTVYNYAFTICGSNFTSPVGRTKTSPAPTDNLDEVRLVVFSCSNYRKWDITKMAILD